MVENGLIGLMGIGGALGLSALGTGLGVGAAGGQSLGRGKGLICKISRRTLCCWLSQVSPSLRLFTA